MPFDRAKFYNVIKQTHVLGPVLSPTEVSGTEALLDAMFAAKWPIAWAANGLGTAFHETAGTMQPVREYGNNEYKRRLYDVTGSRSQLAIKMGNTMPGDGLKYDGKGYVQLTWKNNYKKMSSVIGKDLVANPMLAMDPAIAAKIMIFGMENGSFTGKKNADYLGKKEVNVRVSRAQLVGARRIINGTDKDDQIAGHSLILQNALFDAGW